MLMRTARFRRLDDYLGGADTVHLYATEPAATTKLVREAGCTTAVRKACTAVIAEQSRSWPAGVGHSSGVRSAPILEDVLSRYGDTHARDKAM
jgi:hypothetical protein